MGILKDSAQLEFYLASLTRWAKIMEATGTPKSLLADLVLTHAVEQNPTLCREIHDSIGEEITGDDGIDKLTKWLKAKMGLNTHSDMVKVLNNFLNTCRRKNPPESLTDFITRFEKNYSEVKKMGESFSETCLAIMLMRQAQLTDTDSQIIMVNLEFDPKAKDKDKQFDNAKAAIRKFQHTKIANHNPYPGHQAAPAAGSKPLQTFLAALAEEYDEEEVESIGTFVTQQLKGGRGGGRGGKVRGGKIGGREQRRERSKVWKCEYCLCHHRVWEQCSCSCTTHARENCPNPDPTKVTAYKDKKKKADQEKAERRANNGGGNTEQQTTQRSYLAYSMDFTEKLAQHEDEYNYTLVSKVLAETEADQFQPLEKLFEILDELEPEDSRDVVEDRDAVVEPDTPVPHSYDAQQGVQVLYRGTGDLTQVRSSYINKSDANSLPFLLPDDTELIDEEADQLEERQEIPIWSPSYSRRERRQLEGVNSWYDLVSPVKGRGTTSYTHSEDPLAMAATLSKREMVFLRTDSDQSWKDTLPVTQSQHKLYLLVDSGSPSTLIGVEDFKVIKSQYTRMIQASFQYRPSNKKYEFGGGEKTFSMGTVRLPIYVIDTDKVPHVLHIWVEILNQQNLPLLFGGRSLINAKGTLCCKTNTLSFDWRNRRLSLPTKISPTGHFHVEFFPMSRQEDELLIRDIVDIGIKEWSDQEVDNIITYIASEDQPDISKIRAPEKINNKNNKINKFLTKKQINHVHQALGHVHSKTLRDMVKRTKLYDDNTLKAIEDLKNCEVCAVEHNRPPKPKIALPRSTNFNHVLAIDLKENKRYSNAPPYILYMVDTFTRFKAAVFIKNKQGSTIAEHLVLEWVKLHGAPKYIMSDRGTEFLNKEMAEFCQFHGIRYTTTASYSPQQNAYVERGHAVADRALERMVTADPKLKPEVALAWVIQAANTLQNVNGFTPFQLVFGRLPRHPTLVEDNPGADQEIADSQAMWARHYRMMMAAREAFVTSESDRILRKALQQRTYTDPSKVKLRDWVYWRRNHERYWRGPAKVTNIDQKNIHCIFHGQPMILNRDDVLLSKPEEEEFTVEQFVMLPAQHQPPPTQQEAAADQPSQVVDRDDGVDGVVPETPVSQLYDAQQGVLVRPGGTGELCQVNTTDPLSANTHSAFFHDNNESRNERHRCPEQGQSQPESESDVQPGQFNNEDQEGRAQQFSSSQSGPDSQTAQSDSQITVSQPCHSQQQSESPDQMGLAGLQSPANSTQSALDLGTPLQCNLCEKETSSRNFTEHCQQAHNVTRPNMRQHATAVQPKPDSIYENAARLKKGVVVVDDSGNYLTLVKPTVNGWTTQNVNTKEERNLELIKDMADMRFIGTLESETEEGINVINVNDERIFVEHGAYTKRIFFTAVTNYHEEQVFVVNIPRSRHTEPACIAAKQKELRDYEHYEVFDVVDYPDSDNIISTEWVLVEKEKLDGTKVTKARLCLRGDQERALHSIPRESPTVNKISVKLLVTLAVSQGWQIRSCDVERAFLQSDQIEREVFVRPPPEMKLPRGKVLQLKKTAYGLVDASRAFFLKQAKELKDVGFHPLTMDPAMFIHKTRGQQMCDAGAAVHVDDALTAGKGEVLDKASEQLETRLKYGTVESLPFRFLGGNYKRLHNGDIIIDNQHFVDNMEVPDMPELTKLKKADPLPEKLQSVFRSLASKLNVLAATSRPDYTYTAKYLTTRYNRATKSDMKTATRLIREAKEETTEIIIPNIGEPEDWILVGVVDASHRTSGNLFAVGGHVVMLLNKHTMATAVIHWASKKIERIVHSSAAAETISMQKLFSTIYLVRRVLNEMCGNRVQSLKCVALTDHQGLFSNLHHLKTTSEDYRLHSDILELRQSIEQEKTVQEVRYVHTSLNIADCLTKSTKSGFMLLDIVRTGQYDLPGGVRVRDSTMTAVRTWNQLMRVEQQDPDLHSAESDQTASSQNSSRAINGQESELEISVLYDSGQQQSKTWSQSSSSASSSSASPSSSPGSPSSTRTSSRRRRSQSTPGPRSTRTPVATRSTPSSRTPTAEPPGDTRMSPNRSPSRLRSTPRTARGVSFRDQDLSRPPKSGESDID